LGRARMNLSRYGFHGHRALHPAVLDERTGDEPFVVPGDGGVLERGLTQGMQHMEAGLARGEPRALFLHSAERADSDVAVPIAAPGTAPVLESQQLFGGFLHEGFHGILIAQPVPTGNRVVGMIGQGVAGFDYRSSAALGGNGVAAHRVNLGDHSDIEAGIHLRDSNRGAETGPAATDNENVVGRNVHYSASSGSAGMEPDELILATLG